jgi:hypothetical protein
MSWTGLCNVVDGADATMEDGESRSWRVVQGSPGVDVDENLDVCHPSHFPNARIRASPGMDWPLGASGGHSVKVWVLIGLARGMARA